MGRREKERRGEGRRERKEWIGKKVRMEKGEGENGEGKKEEGRREKGVWRRETGYGITIHRAFAKISSGYVGTNELLNKCREFPTYLCRVTRQRVIFFNSRHCVTRRIFAFVSMTR